MDPLRSDDLHRFPRRSRDAVSDLLFSGLRHYEGLEFLCSVRAHRLSNTAQAHFGSEMPISRVLKGVLKGVSLLASPQAAALL